MFYWHLQNYVDVVNVEIATVFELFDHRLIIQNQVVFIDKHRSTHLGSCLHCYLWDTGGFEVGFARIVAWKPCLCLEITSASQASSVKHLKSFVELCRVVEPH